MPVSMENRAACSRPASSPKGDSQMAKIAALEAEIALYRHQLEIGREEMQAFAYSVSHDLRAPLRAIEGFSKILIDDFASDLQPEAKKFLEHVISNTQQLSSQIEDLLKYYRMGKSAPQKVNVDTTAIAREALLEQGPEPVKAEVQISELAKAFADPVQLRQVFNNLISNAIKFSRNTAHPKIEIGSRTEKGAVTFWVKDNGVGFDLAHAGKLFQVFQKMHSLSEFPGNGIGLAIARRLIEAHGGCIWAESKPGEGSTFFFSLPTPPENGS